MDVRCCSSASFFLTFNSEVHVVDILGTKQIDRRRRSRKRRYHRLCHNTQSSGFFCQLSHDSLRRGLYSGGRFGELHYYRECTPSRARQLQTRIVSTVASELRTSDRGRYAEMGSNKGSQKQRGCNFVRKDEHSEASAERKQQKPDRTSPSLAGKSSRFLKDGYWKIFRLEVPLELDLGKDNFDISDAVLEASAAALGCKTGVLPRTALSVVRKSFDARKDPKFVYTLQLDVGECLRAKPESRHFLLKLRNKPSKLEFCNIPWAPLDLISQLRQPGVAMKSFRSTIGGKNVKERPRVVVVGSGPAGLFAALVLAESGVVVTLVERGQPVETRGRDIGALMNRHILDHESNLCYGEVPMYRNSLGLKEWTTPQGGAGTWSDGKLTTRIGKNGGSVQTVLATLVQFGAPSNILIDGKPHVGTDRLIHILRAFRQHLQNLGVKIMFGTRMEDLIVRDKRVVGIRTCCVTEASGCLGISSVVEADAVVLAVGHSARDVYESLLSHNVLMSPKDFAVGFRIEHPQELINEIQYHRWASEVQRGKGRVPVADYKVAVDVDLNELNVSSDAEEHLHKACYSFCMCPGGQIVPTSTNEAELCINGMSFSKRSSRWANAALVVTVSANDFSPLIANHGPLAGIAFQRSIEREAAQRGGGKLVSPVQTVPDFLNDKISEHELPASSYRLGVQSSPLHDLLPAHLTLALKQGLIHFNDQLSGFIDKRALLHGVETRTSSPVRIERMTESFESVTMAGLYPIGEGAGYAGGIVSAAVDGMHAGFALAKHLNTDKHLSEVPSISTIDTS